MIAGCYTMHLYCRNGCQSKWQTTPLGEQTPPGPSEYTGQTEGECKAQARKRGWVFGRDHDVTCPRCSKIGKAA